MSEQINPETELLREQIAKERAFQRRRGIFIMAVWATEAILCLWGTLSLWLNGLGWLALILFCIGAFFAYQITSGIKLYRWGKTPIANDEVAQRRQEERIQLFQAAHGQLPSEWRLPSLLTKLTLGLLITTYGIWYIIYHGPQMGGPEGLAGLGLLICATTLVEWKRARRLKTESGAILAERLHAGENTEGVQELNEQGDV
jgi:hypothetical protein